MAKFSRLSYSDIISAMELIVNFAQLSRELVLSPSFWSVFVLVITSGLNELVGIVPYTILLSSEMIFLGVPLSLALLFKIFIFVALPVGLGTAVGSLLVYGLAYWGGKPAIDKFGKRVRLSWESVEKVQSKFRGSWYDEILFLALRTIPFMPGLPVSAAAGILRMHIAPYFFFTAFGSIIKVMIMCILVGFGVTVAI